MQAAADDSRVWRPLAAIGAVVACVLVAFVCLIGTATGDAVTLTSRVAAFALPVALGSVPVAVCAAFVRRTMWDRRRGLIRAALAVYFVFLCVAGLATAASGIGISGPPPMPTTSTPP
jgi:peptidoglycan/LPS O-acetylase OafA/YrhL